jgi:hypothetical protein
MKSTNDPSIIIECRHMIADDERYAENRKRKKEKRARAIKDEILAYCNSVNNPYAPVLDIAIATERAEQSINYYLNQLIADKELPERPKTKKTTAEALSFIIAELLEYGKMYSVYDIAKLLNNKYHLNRINEALYILRRDPTKEPEYDWDIYNKTGVQINSIDTTDCDDFGKKVSLRYWYKV